MQIYCFAFIVIANKVRATVYAIVLVPQVLVAVYFVPDAWHFKQVVSCSSELWLHF